MKCLLSKIITILFIMSYVITPRLIKAAEDTACWVFYPQSLQNPIEDAVLFQDKIVAVDKAGNVMSTTDGETWETIGKSGLRYHSLYTIGNQMMMSDSNSNYEVSADGTQWNPISVQDRLYELNGLPRFITGPDWQYQVSDDAFIGRRLIWKKHR